MLKLKLQDFGHLMWRADSLDKTLMLGKTEGKRRRGRQKMRWLDGPSMQWTWTWANFGRWWGTGRPGVLQSMGLQRVGHDWLTELNWTELNNHQPLPTLSPEGRPLRMWEQRKLAPGQRRAYPRNDFSEPILLYLPLYRKALKALNSRYLLFSD